jgi:hypothetical protein
LKWAISKQLLLPAPSLPALAQQSLPEDGMPRPICRKVHERAKGEAGAAVVHVAHDGAQVRKLGLLNQVAHCGRGE